MTNPLLIEDNLVNLLYDTVDARRSEIRRTAYGDRIIAHVDDLRERGWTNHDMVQFENCVIGSLRGEGGGCAVPVPNSRIRALLAVWTAYANWKAVV